ncbi:MAG: hypothetical protein PWQ10_436 [Patescibacteria group bacterium]|nr:hypothetical protein [Patescibacteria group bacterium]
MQHTEKFNKPFINKVDDEETSTKEIKKQTKDRFSKKFIAFGGTALVLLGFGVERILNNEKPKEAIKTTVIEETQSTQQETTSTSSESIIDNDIEELPTVENTEISSSLLSDPEKFMDTYINNRITAWFNSGSTIEDAEAAYDSRNLYKYATETAAKYDSIFEEALLAEDWKSNSEMVTWVENMKEIHRSTVYYYYLTFSKENDPLDKVGYARSSELLKIKSTITNSDGSLTVISSGRDYDNEKENRVGEELSDYKSVAGDTTEVTRTFIDEDGIAKLSNIKLQRNN